MAIPVLRPFRWRDALWLLRLRNDPRVLAMGRLGGSSRAGLRWLRSHRRWIHIVEVESQRVGYLILCPIWEVTIVLEPSARSQGVGTEVLRSLGERLVARIQPSNTASLRAFEKAGFREDPGLRIVFK